MDEATPVAATVRPVLPNAEEQPVVPVWPIAGRALGLGRSATYAAVGRGEIPVIRIGSRLGCPTAALRRMLQLDLVESGAHDPA